ncbi:accessory gene regulator B family protein [Paenibacillus pini]
MFIQKTSEYISRAVYRNIDIDEDTVEIKVIERKLSLLLLYIVLFITLLIIGLIFDNFIQILIASAALIMVRLVSGGNHFIHPDVCYLVTTLVIISSPILCLVIPEKYDLFIIIFCLIGYCVYSPHDWSGSKKYWIYKTLLLIGFITVFFSREILYIYLVLIPDQIIGNHKYKIL